MVNGPATKEWQVKPGFAKVAKGQSAKGAKIGIGFFFFYFWNETNDIVYTAVLSGAGITGVGLPINSEGEWGEYRAIKALKAFSPEDLHGAKGDIEKIGVGAMFGHNGINCAITAYKGNPRQQKSRLFSRSKVNLWSLDLNFPVNIIYGEWEIVAADRLEQNMSYDPVVNDLGNAMPPSNYR